MRQKYDMSDICVSIISYNEANKVKECVYKIRSFTDCIVIVDNASSPENLKVLKSMEEIENVCILYNSVNKGQASALNQSLEYAIKEKKQFLLTLDQDTEIDKDSIINLLYGIDEEKGIISVGPCWKNEKIDMDLEVSYLITSGNLTLIKALKNAGGYNDKYFIDSVDMALSLALRKNGYHLYKIHNATIQHKIGEYEESRLFKIKYLSHSPNRFFYIYRNHIWLTKAYFKYFPFFCIKLTIFLIRDTFRIIFIEKNKKEKLFMAVRGLKSGFKH